MNLWFEVVTGIAFMNHLVAVRASKEVIPPKLERVVLFPSLKLNLLLDFFAEPL